MFKIPFVCSIFPLTAVVRAKKTSKLFFFLKTLLIPGIPLYICLLPSYLSGGQGKECASMSYGSSDLARFLRNRYCVKRPNVRHQQNRDILAIETE